MTTLGFFGPGAMGAPMALRLRHAGFDTLVWARTDERAVELTANGHFVSRSAATVAARDVVVSCVLDDHAVLQLHHEHILPAVGRGSVVIEHATVAPSLAIELDEEYRARGAVFVSAPVSGGPPGAASGQLVTMVGGGAGAPPIVADVLRATCSTIVQAGDIAAGLRLKLINQLLVGMHSALAGETAALVRAAGIDPEVAHGALMGGWAASTRLDLQLVQSATGTYAPDGAGIGQFREILRHLETQVTEAGTRRSMLPHLIEVLEEVAARDWNAPFAALVEAFEPEEPAAEAAA